MAAVVVDDSSQARVEGLLDRLRASLGRGKGHPLSWKNLKGHSLRMEASGALGDANDWLTISAVVVCKRHLETGAIRSDENAYLYTLRYLLERLSWLGRDRRSTVGYTLSHITRFKLATLREYEARLRSLPTEIKWEYMDPRGGMIDQPARLEGLQLADLAASAIFQGFEPDRYGRTEDRYTVQLAPALYRRPQGSLMSYGLKMHPWNKATQGAYSWVTTL